MANCGAEFRAVEASGIPSEVFVCLAACGVGRLKIPVWKFHKSEKGYGLSLFWRTGEGRPDTLNNANNSPQHGRLVAVNGLSKRKQRSQKRMQEFLQRKRARAEVEPRRPDADSTGIPEVSAPCQGRCEKPKSPSCSLGARCLPATPAPMDLAGTPVTLPTTPIPMDLTRCPAGTPTTDAPTDLTGTPVVPPTTSAPTDLSETSAISLTACESVMYEMRDDIPGVKFEKGGQAGWTPVQKSGLDQAIDREEGNGTLTTPRRATMKKLQIKYAKEVAYREISGTPGLLFRRGNTRHSYEWLPVVPSPIASRTRNKTVTVIDSS